MQRPVLQTVCGCSRWSIVRTSSSSYSTAAVFRPPPSKLLMSNKNKSQLSNANRLAAMKSLFDNTLSPQNQHKAASARPSLSFSPGNTVESSTGAGNVKKTGRARRDEEIASRWITYVNDKGEVHQRIRLDQVLQEFDRNLYFLVEVDASARPPVCRLFEKKHLFDKQKASKKKKTVSSDQIIKEIVFGWNVSLHDMGHKLDKAMQFLDKGNKVKIDIVYKKGQKRVDNETQKQVIDQVRQQLNEYKLAKSPSFSGSNCTMQFEQKK